MKPRKYIQFYDYSVALPGNPSHLIEACGGDSVQWVDNRKNMRTIVHETIKAGGGFRKYPAFVVMYGTFTNSRALTSIIRIGGA